MENATRRPRRVLRRSGLALVIFVATVVVYGVTPETGTGRPFTYLRHALHAPATAGDREPPRAHPRHGAPATAVPGAPAGAAGSAGADAASLTPSQLARHRHRPALVRTGYEELALAYSLATTGTFANPFNFPTGPSAHMGPVFPALVAVLIRLVGVGRLAYAALLWSAILVVALQLALYPRLAAVLGMERLTGAVAALAWLLTRYPLHEEFVANYAGLGIVLLLVPMLRCFDEDAARWRILATGLGAGVLVLLQPAAALPILVWLLLLAGARLWQRALLLLALQLLVVLPWCARNELVLGQWSFVRGNAGLELDVADNDCAQFSYLRNRATGCFQLHHPNENPAEAERVRRLGEAAYDGEKMAAAKAWIASHPRRFAALTLRRMGDFLLPEEHEVDPGGLPWMVPLFALLGLGGVVLLWRGHRRGAALVTVWLLCFTLQHGLVSSTARYRVPILWAFLLPGSHLLVVIARRLAGLPSPASAARPGVEPTRPWRSRQARTQPL